MCSRVGTYVCVFVWDGEHDLFFKVFLQINQDEGSFGGLQI